MVTNAVAMPATRVIKRAGHAEPYREAALHASVRNACRAIRALEGEAIFIADHVARSVASWIDGKPEITSRDIRERAFEALVIHSPAAAYAYDVHDSIL